MRLPSTFFLRLDSHQAAIVVGIFELLFHVPLFGVLVLLQVIVTPTNEDFYSALVKELNDDEDKVKSILSTIFSLTFVEFFNIIASGLMVCAVIYRKKRLVLPWFFITGIDILSLISQYALLLVYDRTLKTAVIGVILLTIVYSLILLSEAYSALVVFCSFLNISKPVTPNRAVQFQTISSLLNAPTPRTNSIES